VTPTPFALVLDSPVASPLLVRVRAGPATLSRRTLCNCDLTRICGSKRFVFFHHNVMMTTMDKGSPGALSPADPLSIFLFTFIFFFNFFFNIFIFYPLVADSRTCNSELNANEKEKNTFPKCNILPKRHMMCAMLKALSAYCAS
jgi:hypothetical protein